VIQVIAVVVGSIAGFLPHLVAGRLGHPLGVFGDFMLGSIVGGIAYVVTIYELKKLRGDF
jgi:uncharacterized membrane protein YeaQ/YmgE (transglycosylase-associated protein family)